VITKQLTKLIGSLSVVAIVLIVVVGYTVFENINSKLLHQQEAQFHLEFQSRINTFKDHIGNLSQTFKSYAQLPSFKSIRYYSLTLNYFAVEENTRQLELYFFDLLKNNDYLLDVRYIDNDANEIFHVDKSTIYSDLGNVIHDYNIKHRLEQDLGPDEFHVDIKRDSQGKLKSLLWGVPVYTSVRNRSGYLIFDVDVSLLTDELTDISEEKLTYVVISHRSDNLSQDEYQLASETLPDNFIQQDKQWMKSSHLPLIGLNWKIHVIGDKEAHTEGIVTLQSAIKYGFIPSSILILAFLLYVFIKKVEADKHIHHLAYYDSLTGLINRHQFDDVLNSALDETEEHDTHHALLYLDLDQFKVVNDTCGHVAGDKLLEELSLYLKRSVRGSDMLARLGGDEFALLLNSCPEERAINIAEKILLALSEFHFIWDNKSFSVGASIGVAFITDADETSNNILRKADLACYMAKELGRNRIHVYTDEDKTLGEMHGEMQWVARIKHAIKEDRFFLVAHSIEPLNKENGVNQHYEVLIRLHEKNIVIEPGAFIPAAERYGVMTEIDKWVIDKSFSFMKKLRSSDVKENNNIIFSINLSGLSLGDKSLLPYIKEKFLQYEIPHEAICFEITETAAIANMAIAMDFIDNVKSLGCSLALDDFGSGLCSFSYLKSIPVDYLKIDGSFITRMLENSLDMAIVMAIKEIGVATNSKVIAEFVSSQEIRDKLQELGIDYAQGYGISMPVPMSNIFKLVDINSINQSA